MAEVRPFRALHYNLSAIGSLADVTAPPYDVIDRQQRAELLARSPFNVVEIDLPDDLRGGDRYAHAAETLDEWILQGILTADREPAIWALGQRFTGPDGAPRERRGILARVRLTPYGPGLVRPHERTQPGPKEDRLLLTQATRHNLSPVFALHPGDAWRHVEPSVADDPWGRVTDGDGTEHSVWRIDDPGVHEAVAAELADAELLIADGHHRYETARAYAEEIGGEGDHRYTLMCVVSLDDPGLTVFATHRLLRGLELKQYEVLGSGLKRLFEVEEVPAERLDPAGIEGVGVFGYVDSHFRRGFRLRLAEAGMRELDETLAGEPEAYRRLDAVVLEQLVLKGILGMTDEDIAAKRGIGYASRGEEAWAAIESAEWDCAFYLRPTPIEQVRAVAAAGVTMPPKSTYFFPKLLTGLVFNPLS